MTRRRQSARNNKISITTTGILWFIVATPFVASALVALLPSTARNSAGLVAGAVSLLLFVLTIAVFPQIQAEGLIKTEVAWLPALRLNLIIRVDGLSWLFAVLITVIGFLVILYARYYMSPRDPVPRFFSFILSFMGAMLGLVLSGNLIQLAFFWELTSLFSFLLIGYWNHLEAARSSARMALIVTATGGLCLLVGILLIGKVAGSYDLDVVLAAANRIKASGYYLPALILILLGAFTKSAQFPFHFWLPHAMAAPTPVSAYLHSATMVKAGIFVLMRFWPVLAGTQEWYLIVSSAGLLTFVLGAWCAIFQHDLKGLLAYSTISHLGIITLLLGLGSPLGLVAAIFHTVNHAAFKASLFMAAGIIDHETGTRDIRRLSGLYSVMPITATLATVAAAAMAGVPLLNGFLSKEMFLAETLEGTSGTILDTLLPIAATAALALSVLYSLRFVHKTFFGPPPVGLAKEPCEPPFWMRLPITVLVVTCLLIGIFPAATVGPALEIAVTAVLRDQTPHYSLAIWHGFTQPLMLSILALALGAGGYHLLQTKLNAANGAPGVRYLKGRRMFETVLAVVVSLSRILEKLLGTHRLQSQLRIIVAVASLAAFLPFLRYGYGLGPNAWTPLNPAFTAIWIAGSACAIGAAWQAKYHRLAALILMSGAGLASCISFVWLSAPDLALTQLLVETVTTVLILLGLRWMPKREPIHWLRGNVPGSVLARRGADLALAILAGAGMAALSLAVMTFPIGHTMSRYFIENAYSLGGGRNVVNVILVDFRALDTLGEITVLAIVGLTIYAMLRRFRPATESVCLPQQQEVQNAYDQQHENRAPGDTLSDYLFVPRVVVEWLFAPIVVFAMYLLLRGHDAPGGGFAAGVTMSIGLVLQYMVAGTRSIESRLGVQPLRWMGAGLLLALLTGLGSWVFGYPFLTSWFRYADIPLIGQAPLASALLFDLGVFFVVVGSTTLVLIAIAHQSIRTPTRRARIASLTTRQVPV